MWHLYYKDTNIYCLSKTKQSLDLPYLRVDDDTALKFINLEYRYIDWHVIKQGGRCRLARKENKVEPSWHKKFYQVPPGTVADIVVVRNGDVVSCDKPVTFWITEWNNPLRYIGKINASELLVPPGSKISIFTNKITQTVSYNDKNILSGS